MRPVKYVAGAAAVAVMMGALALAGEPDKQRVDPSGSADIHKKCPYTTQECLNSMAAKMKASGWIGIEYDPDKDFVITHVVPGSPAEKAGLLPGDRLATLNGIEIKPENETALMAARKQWTPGQVVHYTIKRNGATKAVDITLGQWPADLLARYIGEHMLQHAEADAAPPTPK